MDEMLGHLSLTLCTVRNRRGKQREATDFADSAERDLVFFGGVDTYATLIREIRAIRSLIQKCMTHTDGRPRPSGQTGTLAPT